MTVEVRKGVVFNGKNIYFVLFVPFKKIRNIIGGENRNEENGIFAFGYAVYHARRDQEKKILLQRYSMGVDRDLHAAFQYADKLIAVVKMRCKIVSVIDNSTKMGRL